MSYEFKLPDIGEGVVEGEITEWHVSPGDTVEEDQVLFEVMTDKATVEISSPRSGTVKECRGNVGDIIPVGDIIVVIDEGAAAEAANEGPSTESVEPVQERAPEAAGASTNGAHAAATSTNGSGTHHPLTKALAAPAVRRLARELDCDLTAINGTGSRGQVTRRDVEAYAAQHGGGVATEAAPQPAPVQTSAPQPQPSRPAPQPISIPSEAPVERIPYRGLRKAIGDKMVQSAFTATHFTYVEEVDMTELVTLRSEVKAAYKAQGLAITYLPFITKAVIAGLRQYPMLNATLDDAAGEIIVKHYYNIGIAASTDAGLIVPVVKNADQKSIVQLARDIQDLGERARAGKNSLDELKDGTFTISSLGKDGGLMATPIINHPEVGIVGIHKIRKTPMVMDDDRIEVRHMMNLSCSFDHRIIDGHIGAEFTNVVARLLESPRKLFLEG